jgi:Family of unknown function (DUF6345)
LASTSYSATELPVYHIATSKISEEQVGRLAEESRISLDKILVRDDTLSFVDPATYLAVPMVVIDDPEMLSSRAFATTNHFSEIPLQMKAIDYEALQRLEILDDDGALVRTQAALEAADIVPESASPFVGHTLFKTSIAREDGEGHRSTVATIDTHVRFRFTLDGYLLVGPGAQVQFSFGPEGIVTRLIHATRKLEPGPTVEITPVEQVQEHFGRFLPDDAEVTIRLLYWAPPLRSGIYPSKHWSPSVILPWHAITITRQALDPRTGTTQPRTSRVHLVPATSDSRFVPSVTLKAIAAERTLVEARATASGGTPPYTYFWAGSNPETATATGDSVSYEPVVRDFRRLVPSQSFDRTEALSVTVVDANGISVQAGQSVAVTARPAPETHSSVTFGCESPNDPGPSPSDGSYSPERIAWQNAMGAAGQGGGTQRFCWLADSSWPGDYIEPNPPGSLVQDPWINGDADYSNWGINTTNIMLYNGDGWPTGFAEMYPGATLAEYNASGGGFVSDPGSTDTVAIGSQNYAVNYDSSWGAPHPNDNLQWLAMYACQILEDDANTPTPPWQRWGVAFNGLHSLLGFETEASDAGVGFMTDFPLNILGTALPPPQTIVQGWLSSAIANDMGTPAAMGPLHALFFKDRVFYLSNYADYYWGKGSVSYNIYQQSVNGWWYIQGTDAPLDYP